MKIINLLYIKYALSLMICILSSFVIFFIFSLISNLSEDYLFSIIVNLSALNSLQILTYVPTFIFLISLILFSIFLRSKNEIIIIKSYLSIGKLMIFFLPIVMSFSIFESNKINLANYFEDYKLNLVNSKQRTKSKILIDDINGIRTITIFENLDLTNLGKTKYRSYNIFDKDIKIAEYSDNLIYSNNILTLNNYTQYKNNVIENFNSQKNIKIDLTELMSQNSLVKNISVKNNSFLSVRFINLLVFSLFFLSFTFLNFFNSKYLGPKQSLRNPILISLSILIYSFIIFNNSIISYKQEFELLASVIVFMLFFKAYLNE
mgnify:CR=1 FL=1